MTPTVFVSFVFIFTSFGICSSQQTLGDFYSNNANIVEQVTNPTLAPSVNLPININNIQNTNGSTIDQVVIRKGRIQLTASSTSVLDIDVLYPSGNVLDEGEVKVYIQTDSAGLDRALNDITAAYPDVDQDLITPTHLILFNNLLLGPMGTPEATSFQLVLATNGMHTYAIILFVSVEAAAANRGDSARITGITGDPFDLPYANDNILQAPSLSNTGVQGKYVYDLNLFDPPPPPPCPSCIERTKSVICQLVRFKHASDGSNNIPRPCQE